MSGGYTVGVKTVAGGFSWDAVYDGDGEAVALAYTTDMAERIAEVLNGRAGLLAVAALVGLVETLDQYEGSHAGLDAAREVIRKAKGESA